LSVAARLRSPVGRRAAALACGGTWLRSARAGDLPGEWEGHASAMAAGLRAAEVVVAPSAAFAEALVEVYGSLPALRVVPNGSRSIPSAKKKGRFVFAAGRWWDEAKNLACLDAAAADIAWPLHAAGPLQGPLSAAPPSHHVVCLGP